MLQHVRRVLLAVALAACLPVVCRGGWDEDDDPVSTVLVDAVLGRSVTLPCDIEPTTREDRVYMVLWFRDNAGKPLYRFDVRGRPFTKALYWSDNNAFGPRAYFVTGSTPAGLTLETVQLDDEGIYRCRVDFKNSPTRNFQINLTVIVPPNKLLIYDISGRAVNNNVVGPLSEDTDLILMCEVRGGKPPPTVSWFVNDRLVDGILEATKDNIMVNRLEITRIRRKHLNTTFKCQASNTKLTLPQEKTVRLELNLKPLNVQMLSKPSEFVANTEYSITCESYGSRPPAVITWLRETRIFHAKTDQAQNETAVSSTVTFSPTPEDDNKVLRCKADNEAIPDSSLEDTLTLSVVYPPLVTLQLGSTLNAQDIKEGDDVYFECSVKANPKEHKITWLHNGAVVTQNMSSGVILSTQSLVLQGVTRHHAGSYTCQAANERGETASPPVHLRVQYSPVCSNEDVVVVGASVNEMLRVRCLVAADPADVSFVWQFNNSGESFDVSPVRFGTSHGANGSSSELRYTPTSDRDYGTLTCWGTNPIGRQQEPCVFQVVSAVRPAPLRNCTLRSSSNQSADVLDVECVAGYDGGLRQAFYLEAYESRSMRLRLNVTSVVPDAAVFRLDLADLLPARNPTLHIVIYAANQKGRSEATVLEDITLKDAEKRTEAAGGEGGAGLNVVPLAALLTGTVLTLGVAALLVAVLAVRRRRAVLRSAQGALCAHHLQADTVKHKVQTSQPVRHSSMLEINHGEHRYVVSYTLKTRTECGDSDEGESCVNSGGIQTVERHPDILNPPQEMSQQRSKTLMQPSSDPISCQPPDYSGHISGHMGSEYSPSSPDSLSSVPSRRSRTAGGRITSAPLPFPNPGSNLTSVMTSTQSCALNGGLRKEHIISNTIPGPESCV
ncbi:hypothetical protein R5R35_009404 [Gryllus longicercus]|uniref:Ig-like domain-containing protein n=1 Tax=Gryllus longicercus TaxID=2509291 RepID=A0AAN9VNI2_9ORTH